MIEFLKKQVAFHETSQNMFALRVMLTSKWLIISIKYCLVLRRHGSRCITSINFMKIFALAISIKVYLAWIPELPLLLAWYAKLVAEGTVLLKHLHNILLINDFFNKREGAGG